MKDMEPKIAMRHPCLSTFLMLGRPVLIASIKISLPQRGFGSKPRIYPEAVWSRNPLRAMFPRTSGVFITAKPQTAKSFIWNQALGQRANPHTSRCISPMRITTLRQKIKVSVKLHANHARPAVSVQVCATNRRDGTSLSNPPYHHRQN